MEEIKIWEVTMSMGHDTNTETTFHYPFEKYTYEKVYFTARADFEFHIKDKIEAIYIKKGLRYSPYFIIRKAVKKYPWEDKAFQLHYI